jgi:hypothetical protein
VEAADEAVAESSTELVRLAQSYLVPELPVDQHDRIADNMRVLAAREPMSASVLARDAVHDDPLRRVVAYVRFQMQPSAQAAHVFPVALQQETSLANATHETRPLWQLLVAIGVSIDAQIVQAHELPLLRVALRATAMLLETMAGTQHVDSGGECRLRLRLLSEALSKNQDVDLANPAARRALEAFASQMRLVIGPTVEAAQSVTGERAYRARETDGMGLLYCYASGPNRGRIAWVRKGIGIAARRHEQLRALGFPLGREETMEGGAFSRFERGFVEWKESAYHEVRAFLGEYPDRSRPLGPSLRI